MKTFKLNKIAALAIAAASFASVSSVANACSRISTITPEHGLVQVRSLDWDAPLGTVAKVVPVGTQRASASDGTYQNMATWTVKYASVELEEHDFFHGTVAAARNSEGMIADTLYQTSSLPFVEKHAAMDNGSMKVGLGNMTGFLVENYKTADEVKAAFESGEFDIAWGQNLMGDKKLGKHGLHLGVQDKHGKAVLFQLGAEGKTVMYYGDIRDTDLGVMANDPLLPESRAYAQQFGDYKDPDYLNRVPSGIRSMDRFSRLVAMTKYHNKENYKGKTHLQAMGALNGAFDQAANLAQFMPNGTQPAVEAAWDATHGQLPGGAWNVDGRYPSRVKYSHIVDTGLVKFDNLDTYESISFNMNDISQFTTEVCADLVAQAAKGKQEAEFTACN